MKKDEAIVSEMVEALEARAPFRFPREMVVGLLALAVAWQVLSLFVPPFIVPGWERIFKSLVKLPMDFVLITLARVVAALIVSFALGLGLAVLMYASTPIERYGRPLVRLLMAVPVVCWILFAVLWFKWVEFRIAFVLVVVCAPVFLVDILDAMRGVSKDLRDMLRSFRPTRAHAPAARPARGRAARAASGRCRWPSATAAADRAGTPRPVCRGSGRSLRTARGRRRRCGPPSAGRARSGG